MKKFKKSSNIASVLIIVIGFMTIAQASAIDPSIMSLNTGHRFIEESWAIEYDVLSGTLLEDYTPGEYSGEFNDTTIDRAPYRDANFYIAYVNMGQVQTIYMAFTEYTNDNRDITKVGIAPYQMLQQHFKTSGGEHVIIQNSFAGLLAYQDVGFDENVPDKNDSIYYGNSLSSQYYKYLLNHRFDISFGITPFDMDVLPSATPINLTKTIVGDSINYEFGMSYENIFVVWHSINVDANLNRTTTAEDLISKIVAVSSIDYLNFTYQISGKLVEDKPVNVTTTTEYDIGPVSDLWVINDTESATADLGGDYYDFLIMDHTLSHYNTSEAIQNRLDGDENTPGFSLAISNYARTAVIAASIEDQEDIEVTTENGTIIDSDSSDCNVTSLDIHITNVPAFSIDFASKPNYTLDGGEPMFAPVKLFPRLRLRDGTLNSIDQLSYIFLNAITRNMVQTRIDSINEKFNLEGKEINLDITRSNVFYAICFPEWSGKSINQDPTFTAISAPAEINTNFTRERLIAGYGLSSLILIGISSISIMLFKKSYRKNKDT